MESGIGYRFHLTDQELIHYYLKLKMLGRDNEVNIIPEINVLQYEPWEISGKAMKMSTNSNDQVWYFFCAHNYKYKNSQRVDRKTNTGFWKVTGQDRKIVDVGVKKTLVFYRGKFSDAVKTNWIMYQYSATFDFPTNKDFVICKLKYKAGCDDVAAVELDQGQNSTSNFGYNETQYDCDQIQAYFQGYEVEDYSLNSVLQWSNDD